MSLLIVGTIAFDSVETPWSRADRILGGSGTYASFAASFFMPPRLVGVVGEDFPEDYLNILREKKIDTSGVVRLKGKTFFWAGRYEENMNIRTTLTTELNVLSDFNPVLTDEASGSDFVFLANIDPDLQSSTLAQCSNLKFSVIDSMNFWITEKRASLDRVLQRADAILINDEEAKMLCGTPNLMSAAKTILGGNPRVVIIKKGEHGIMMVTRDSTFCFPAYPIERVQDPTGAGDSFAGGFIGFLAKAGDVSDKTLRQAVVAGSVTASFCCEDFSINRFRNLGPKDINDRIDAFFSLSKVERFDLR